MGALAEVVAALDPELRAHAVADPPRGDFEHRLGGERAVVVEAVAEGHRLHYGEPRAFERLDPGLRLLGGDALYALGVARLAERGDLAAIAELCDLISGCAQAHAEGRPAAAEALWEASVARLAGERRPPER